ncbi:trehalose-6-phosphate hydrolase [Lasiosphaeria ovina]|uniref:Trehalose-6-phosphate hydrolase n=1 Tax=Lasiosphaeria ovina TaxID=92902 RepID=A0AAE0N5I7_9PEZI|nr:trehalose-6-phosphate hydrolase [Lasiosphaeria ovina]
MASQDSTYASPKWWKEAIIYQVYPSSFQSHPGNTTGWGSVKGITSRLDYLKELGVDVLWTSPIYKSPQADMGYDIADYEDIDPCYGTLADVDDLIRELKRRDMRLVMDLVVNHTSNQHAWFLESKSSKTNPKRDWYIWKAPKSINPDGSPEPPNNWAQILGEANSAWNYDQVTGEYYLGLFTPDQPDLNWENPEVREAVWDVMHFWLKRGVSGFRMDVINLISKVPSYPDAPLILGPGHKYQPGQQFFVNGPKLHDYLTEMNRQVLSKYDALALGEMPFIYDEDEILKAVGARSGELNMIFIFGLVDIDNPNVRMALKPWTVREMKAIITRWQRTMIEKDGWNTVFIENHDQPRSVSRYADDSDEWRDKGAKLLALMQTTLGGTLFVYQGEEIGMRNARSGEWPPEAFRDVETINYWKKVQTLYANDPDMLSLGRKVMDMKARDHARTPMQWSAAPNAGFCDPEVTPWMRVMSDYKTVNVESQMQQQSGEDSDGELTTWQFWQRCLKNRAEHKEVFVYGDFHDQSPADPNVYAYIRTSSVDSGDRWLVVLNFSGQKQRFVLPEALELESWALGNYVSEKTPRKPLGRAVDLQEWEGLIGKVRR